MRRRRYSAPSRVVATPATDRPRPDPVMPVILRVMRMIGAVVAWCWARLLDLLWLLAVGAVLYTILAVLAHQGMVPWAAPLLTRVRQSLAILWRLLSRG